MISNLNSKLISVFAFYGRIAGAVPSQTTAIGFSFVLSLILFTTVDLLAQRVENRNAAGQIIETYTNVDNKKQGPYASFYANGAKNVETQYDKGNINGRYVAYHANGKIAYETTFAGGQLTGTISEYYESGQLSSQGTTYGGKYGPNAANSPLKTGVWITYHENGKKASEGEYVKDARNGRWLNYHTNGNVYRDSTFEAGNLTGTFSEYHENGQLAIQGTTYGDKYGSAYNPLKTGLWTSYYPDGKKASEGQYVKDNRHGRWLIYHKNGNLYIDATFDAGQNTGTVSEYYESGQLMIQGTTYGGKYGPNAFNAPLKTGLWVKYDRAGNVTEATNYVKDVAVGKASYSTDTTTGKTRIVASNPDGTRTVLDVDKNGIITNPGAATTVAANSGPASVTEAGDLIGMQTDPVTGQTSTVRRNPDGSTSTYTGRRIKDADGTERLVETDAKGNRIETSIAPDGTLVVTKSSPGKGETRTTTEPTGRITTIERDVAGNTIETGLIEDGTLVTVQRNLQGETLATVRESPDGKVEYSDSRGSIHKSGRDISGQTVTVSTDRFGNVTTTVFDKDGKFVSRDANVIAPREPGRDYFEKVLNGTDWDRVPQSLKNRYADSERSIQENEARRAEGDAVTARKKVEDARRAAESATASEAQKKAFDNLKVEQARADQLAAQRKAKVDRRAEIERSYETADRLQREYDGAIARGDRAEAKRVLALQDEHHEKSMMLLEQTPDERAAMDRYSDSRSRLANEITAAASRNAAKKIADDEALQDTKDKLASGTKYLAASGSQMQEATRAATRSADREKTMAQAKQQEIARRLADPATTAEQRGILSELQTMAILQESGAGDLLAANARLNAAAYGMDAVVSLSGAGKVLQVGGRLAVGTAGALRNVIAGRVAARTATTAAISGSAGTTTIVLAKDTAAKTFGLTSRMTAAERAAFLETRISTSLAGAPRTAGRAGIEFTRAELVRLHTVGAKLTAAELVKKGEIYYAKEFATLQVNRAITEGAPRAVVESLRAEALRLNRLVKEASDAAILAARN